ncbi:hypothetical protein H5410_054882, partial [Solanum commersonii]
LRDGKFSISIYHLSLDQLVEDVRKLNCLLSLEPRYCNVYYYCDRRVFEPNSLLLWNNCMGKLIVLPFPKFSVKRFCFFSLRMSFDSTSGDYKIFKIPQDRNKVVLMINIIVAITICCLLCIH